MQIHEADGVFQGGGVKVLALAGALLGFHERGYRRWINVAGAGSGALVAAYLACGHDARSVDRLLRAAPYRTFADVGGGGPLLGRAWNLVRRHGLARGETLRRWLDAELEGRTFATVRTDGTWRLRLIAADITHRELLVLPDDLERYRFPGTAERIDPDRFGIADAVRMSMSLPYYFQPVELVRHDSGEPAEIVDGGLLTNVPVWLFDVAEAEPLRPTFGFRVTGGRASSGVLRSIAENVAWPAKLGSDIFHTAMEAADERLMSSSTRARICCVPAGGVATTAFRLPPVQQTELVEAGRRAARRFLDAYDPEEYANTYGRRLATAVRG